ncbi:hypothetical protein AQUCO_04100047v1 [Aquilegia coerulea]|uniref:Uncharacterized protein n=1 Tax=Aquilegia coerulea TaxID=218851 RepID=A0A2G5CR81_AQUCA|nr:hypothetical protein AQUCO_04100047v1 [Aquilegia coerulea]
MKNQLKPPSSITKLFNLQFNIFIPIAFCVGLFIGTFIDHIKNPVSVFQDSQFSITSTISSSSSPSPPPPLQVLLSPPSPSLPPPPPPPQSHERVNVSCGTSGLKEHAKTSSTVFIHNMKDDELLWRASMVPRIRQFPYKRVPKVAFMFLTKWEVALAPLWEKFFKGYEGLYSIYVHSHPSFNKSMPNDSVFHGRVVPSKTLHPNTDVAARKENRQLNDHRSALI